MEGIIYIAICIALFFVFRSLLLWYWKVDTIVKNQEETNRLLTILVNKIERAKDNDPQQTN